MNAYELAGRLLEKKLYLIQEGVNSSYLEDASNMLRQQADRIAELEATIKAKNNYLAQHCGMIDEQQKDIKNLEDSLKNALIFIDNHKQTKPLSDEEILEIAGKYWVNRLHYALYFARAIEAKVRG